MFGFGWIRVVNVVNKVVAFCFFLYLVLADSFSTGLKYAFAVVIAFGVIGLAGASMNKSRQGDPIEELALFTGHMPPFMLKVLLATTVLLVGANSALIWYFLK